MKITISVLAWILTVAFASAVKAEAQPQSMRLQYDRPARYFEESLPIGNGKIGALLYGGTDVDSLYLNDITLLDSLWTTTRMRARRNGFRKSERHSLTRTTSWRTRCSCMFRDITHSSSSRSACYTSTTGTQATPAAITAR